MLNDEDLGIAAEETIQAIGKGVSVFFYEKKIQKKIKKNEINKVAQHD